MRLSSSGFVHAALILLATTCARAAVYDILRIHAGNDFFNGWAFRGNYNFTINTPTVDDPDHAFNYWANETWAMSTGLAKILPNGNALIKVDNATDGSGFMDNNMELRFSTRIDSEEYYGTGNVIVADIVHLPWGCSVWPAFWLSGNDGTFPAGGEIDIVEEVNKGTQNHINIHAEGTCTVDPAGPNVDSSDCGDAAHGNHGCKFTNASLPDFGDAFNNLNGGMWVTEFAADAINVWFFSRADIPAALLTTANASSVDTSSLGAPVANVPASAKNCDFGELFNPVKIVFSIALCGSFAGGSAFANTCDLAPGLNSTQTCYQDWVAGPGSNYDDAFFEIASVRVFNDGSPSSYGTNNQTVKVAAPGQGGPVPGESASAPGGTSTTDVVSVSTSPASGGSGGGAASGGHGSGGAVAHQPGALGALAALVFAVAAGAALVQ